jgi:hypothetical protein
MRHLPTTAAFCPRCGVKVRKSISLLPVVLSLLLIGGLGFFTLVFVLRLSGSGSQRPVTVQPYQQYPAVQFRDRTPTINTPTPPTVTFPQVPMIEPTHPSWPRTSTNDGGIRVVTPKGKDFEYQWIEAQRNAERMQQEVEVRTKGR